LIGNAHHFLNRNAELKPPAPAGTSHPAPNFFEKCPAIGELTRCGVGHAFCTQPFGRHPIYLVIGQKFTDRPAISKLGVSLKTLRRLGMAHPIGKFIWHTHISTLDFFISD
jgi:hypothetical protein